MDERRKREKEKKEKEREKEREPASTLAAPPSDGEFRVDARQAYRKGGQRTQRICIIHDEHIPIDHSSELQNGFLQRGTRGF